MALRLTEADRDLKCQQRSENNLECVFGSDEIQSVPKDREQRLVGVCERDGNKLYGYACSIGNNVHVYGTRFGFEWKLCKLV